ncbi:MAG: outer membrane beta-barrel protein, partial [Alphaproteobacteria bacterium]|nr:outer membrane beta-barrel protein [Alphaproteobacteria bacterium]
MRKLGLAIALASTAMASPSLAKDGAWYLGGDVGAIIVEDSESTYEPGTVAGLASTTGVTANTPHKVGYDAAGYVGYDFGAFRLEAEYSHKKAMNKNTSYSNVTAGDLPGGQARVDSIMLNGMLDFGPDDGLQGFVGGGVGVARSKISLPDTRDSDTGFAWQAIAGVRYPVSNSVDLSLKYRFFNHDNIDLMNTAGTALETEVRSHSILAGLVFNFGGEEPA